jgi:hypothetical protein
VALHKPPKIGVVAKTTHTVRYHIDYDWWEKSNRDLRIYLQSHLCPEHQALFADFAGDEQVDWIDPRTAEVRRVDGLEHTLHTHCSQQPDYISPQTTLINAIFCVFLANGNSPLTVEEIAAKTGRMPETIQRTLSGDRIYKGILPVPDEGEA